MPVIVQTTDSNGSVTTHSGTPAASNAAANWGTLTSTGGDLGGVLGATSSATPAAGRVLDVAFSSPFASAPKAVVVGGQLGAYATSVTATGFSLTTTATAAAQAYVWHYTVVP
jgi:hypothetical protein